ncbi:MAG: resuscitation-promoting factor RpfA [Actinomycetota bacterium]|nr:resuscitation-promoting factor RpfA [Actinomycetota bacterium]
MTRAFAAVRLLAWIAFLAAALAALHRIGHGPLAPPSLDGGRLALQEWLDRRGPAAAAFAIVRMAAVVLGWYLLGTTLASSVLRLVHAGRVVSLADALALPTVRRLTQAVAGIGLAATTVASTALIVPARPALAAEAETVTMRRLPDPDADPPPTMRRLGDDPTARPRASTPATTAASPPRASTPATTTSAPPSTTTSPAASAAGAVSTTTAASGGPAAGPSPTSTMTSMPTITSTSAATTASASPASSLPTPATTATRTAAEPRPAHDEQATTATWTVRPGDHFWRIAEAVLAEAWQRPPTDDEITPYWSGLVEHNRPMLADPHDADLLFPGQQVAILTPPPKVSTPEAGG